MFATAAGGNGTLLAVNSDGSGQLSSFNLFEKDSSGVYQPINQGAWPGSQVKPSQTTVVLFTDSPFGTPQPFPFQNFSAGDWATMATFSAGQVTASVETFESPDLGLGNPMLQSLNPDANPGFGAQALGNQWEPSSSLFYPPSTPTATGVAAVTIKPAAGSYPNTIAAAFSAHPQVTVHYRVNHGPWVSGLGPVWIAQDATVQFYGEHGNGTLSPIQTAAYEIDQPPDNDTDGDFVPDSIEALAQTNPFDPDSDDDGENDFSELLGEGDPNDPNSQSASKIDSLSNVQTIIRWDNTNSVALPAQNQDLFIADLSNTELGKATQVPRLSPRDGSVDISDFNIWQTHRVEPASGVAKLWLPSNFKMEVGDLPQSAGAEVMSLKQVYLPPPYASIPVQLESANPLTEWIQAAEMTLPNAAPQVDEYTVGPASTMAALLFEYWYGQRLLDSGLISTIADRPRLADSPRSPRAQGNKAEDVLMVQELLNQGDDIVIHEITHAVQQSYDITLLHPDWFMFRDTANSIYDQAIQANIDGRPLDPPLNVLRNIFDGIAPLKFRICVSEQHDRS